MPSAACNSRNRQTWGTVTRVECSRIVGLRSWSMAPLPARQWHQPAASRVGRASEERATGSVGSGQPASSLCAALHTFTNAVCFDSCPSIVNKTHVTWHDQQHYPRSQLLQKPASLMPREQNLIKEMLCSAQLLTSHDHQIPEPSAKEGSLQSPESARQSLPCFEPASGIRYVHLRQRDPPD